MAIIVTKQLGETKDDIIGKFRRMCMEEDVTEEIRKRSAYISPAAKRYAKKKVIIWREKCRKRAKKRRV
jgi:ribosomal protein S21